MFSCEDDVQVNKISGSLFLDCNNTPASSSQIALKTLSGGSFSDKEIIASSFVSDNGSYDLTYELGEKQSGFGDIVYVNNQGTSTILQKVPLNQNVSASIYLENKSTVIFENNGTRILGIQDTLYYGISGIESSVVGPINGKIDTLQVNVISEYNTSKAATIYYGIGLSDFNKSKEALNIADSVLRHISLTLTGCSQSELVDLGIN